MEKLSVWIRRIPNRKWYVVELKSSILFNVILRNWRKKGRRLKKKMLFYLSLSRSRFSFIVFLFSIRKKKEEIKYFLNEWKKIIFMWMISVPSPIKCLHPHKIEILALYLWPTQKQKIYIFIWIIKISYTKKEKIEEKFIINKCMQL